MTPLLLVEENRDLPLVRAQVTLRTGAADDPLDRDGLTNFASELCGRGAAGRTRAELDAAFDALGTSLEIVTDVDGVTFEVTVLKSKLEDALALMSDVLLRPDFPEEEARKLEREIRAQLDELRDEDGQLARRFFNHALYGTHPYGRTVIGTERSLEQLSAADARAWHKQWMKSGQMIVGFAGDLSAPQAEEAVARHFSTLPGSARAPLVRYPDPPVRGGMRLTLVDKPERTQSQILYGQPAPQWGTPDFYALQVATCAYGGTFTARLMNEVRSKRGLSYGASARLAQGRGRRALVMHVFPSLEQTPETLELVLGLHADWVSNGITADELEFVRGYLASSFAFSIATPEDRLELRTSLELAGLPPDYAQTFPSRIRDITLDDTRRAIERWLTPTDLEICVVSTAGELIPKLDAAGLTSRFTVDQVAYDSY
jgi:zinc protease